MDLFSCFKQFFNPSVSVCQQDELSFKLTLGDTDFPPPPFQLSQIASICLLACILLSLQELVFSASPDATIRIWSVPSVSCVQVVRAHESAVTGLSLHATGDYLLSSSDDQVRCGPEKCIPELG